MKHLLHPDFLRRRIGFWILGGLAGALSAGPVAWAQPTRLTVHADRPGAPVSPLLWGIFFEEINHAGDGGLYAELVRNRSFEDSEQPEHWTAVTTGNARAELRVVEEQPLNPLNRRNLRLRIEGDGCGGVANGGYWGMALRAGEEYVCRFHARGGTNFGGEITVSLEAAAGTVHVATNLPGVGRVWKAFEARLVSPATDPKARLVLSLTGPATVWLDQVTLFPRRTWKDRPNGLRPDLAGLLADLRPAFVRFPGGCWVEGHDLKHAYRWKETVGDVAHRRPQYNLWQYPSTHGLGYHEYLQLCEDLGAEPLFVINCGMSHSEVVPADQMAAWVQDALDAIEYANGSTGTVWGGLRARNGHPEPFGLKYLEIGNENGGPAYHERYAMFHDAVKARHPEIHLVANEWGGRPTGRPVELVDEHYYNTPEFFLAEAGRYDRYDRNGPKVYVGEYAVTTGAGQGNLRAAVGEAAFMTGMERNADVVVMASYAPLFANVNDKKWNPDLINFDSARAYGTPSYWVQRMFSENRGDVVLPVDLEVPVRVPLEPRRGGVGVGTWRTQAEYKDLRVTQGGRVLYASDFAGGLTGWTTRGGEWSTGEGALRQASSAENVQAVTGETGWADYTYTLKARKQGGAEGFLVLFHAVDERNWTWWNIGGWGNSQHALEQSADGGKSLVGRAVAGRVEEGRWYDVRVEVEGTKIRCFLDGQLVHDVEYSRPKLFHASATLDRGRNEMILKLVNAAPAEETVALSVAGVGPLPAVAEGTLLTGPPLGENTLDEPRRVAPRPVRWELSPAGRGMVLPGHAVAVVRLKLAPK